MSRELHLQRANRPIKEYDIPVPQNIPDATRAVVLDLNNPFWDADKYIRGFDNHMRTYLLTKRVEEEMKMLAVGLYVNVFATLLRIRSCY